MVKIINRHKHLLGTEIDVYTDNRALSWILNKPKILLNYRTLVEQLSQFSFKIHYVKSEENVVADFMFRMHDPFEFNLVESKLGKRMMKKNLTLVNLWKIPLYIKH